MKYQDYEKKIKRLRTFRNGIFHLRYVFLGVTLAGIATGSAIMACTGMVNETVSLNSTYEYGETFNPEGNAFLSDVVYQYRAKDSDTWSETPPVNAGKYEYRYYTKNTFGQNKYSAPVAFEIAKKSIEIPITSDRIIYGEDPTFSRPYLIGEDKISSWSFSYDGFETMKTNVCIDDVVIKDASGQDVTNNYEIKRPKREILFEQRFIDITFKGGEKVFDNTAIENNEDGIYDSGKLAFNDHVELGPSKSLTAVGKIANIRDVKIYNELGVDVTHLYRVNKTGEELIVNPRKIVLHSRNIERVYNGKVAEQEWAYEDGSLQVAPGHILDVKFDNLDSWKTGLQPSTFTATVIDEATHEPVNQGLYDIETHFGTVNVKKRPIQIATNSVEKYYDGTTLVDTEFVASGLADGDTIEPAISNSPYINTPGHTINEIPYCIMRGGENVTDCYEPITTWGNLLVKRRPLSCRLNFANDLVYDGKPLELNDTFYEILGKDQDPMSEGLAPGHIEVVDFKLDNNIIDAGNHAIDDFKIRIYEQDEFGQPNLNKEVTQYYDITYPGKTNKINIAQRPISVETPTITKTYDGKPILTGEPSCTKGSLAPGHKFQIKEITQVVDVTNPMGVANKFDIIIVDGNNVNVTKNYIIEETTYGTINIDQCPIEVTPKDVTKDYDDRIYKHDAAELNVNFLGPTYEKMDIKAYGHVKSNQIDVTGEEGAIIEIDDRYPIVVKEANYPYRDLSKNFIVVIGNKNATLQIEPIPIEVGVNSREVVFDKNINEDLTVDDCYMKGEIQGHTLTNVVFNGDIGEPGSESKVHIESYDIYSPSRNITVTGNYFEVANTEATMKSYYGQEIIIRSPDVNRTYDGNKISLTENEKVLSYTPLPNPNHKIVADSWYVDDFYNIKDVDDINYYDDNSNTWKNQNNFSYHIEDMDGNIINKEVYRNIVVFSGNIYYSPREVEYRCRGISKVYDGEQHTMEFENENIGPLGYEIVRNTRNRVYLAKKNALVPGHHLYVTNFGASGQSAGVYNPFDTATFTVYDSMNNPIKSCNYSIIADARSTFLEIKHRDIDIRTSSFNGTYEDFINSGFYNEFMYDPEQLVPGHYIEYEMKDYNLFVQENGSCFEENQPLKLIIRDQFGNDVTGSYSIHSAYGYINVSRY